MKYTDRALIRILQELHKSLRRVPRAKDLKSPPNQRTFYLRFGSWAKALRAASLEPDREDHWSKKLVKQRLRRAFSETEGHLTLEKIAALSYAPSITTIKRHLKVATLPEALVACGLRPIHAKTWRKWEHLCKEAAIALYGVSNVRINRSVSGSKHIPDIQVPSRNLIIDAMTTAYAQRHKLEQVPSFGQAASRVELWCCTRGVEPPNRPKNVHYVYRPQLVAKLKKRGSSRIAAAIERYKWEEGHQFTKKRVLLSLKRYQRDCRSTRRRFSIVEFTKIPGNPSEPILRELFPNGIEDIVPLLGLRSNEVFNLKSNWSICKKRVLKFREKHGRVPSYRDLEKAACSQGCCFGPTSRKITKELGENWESVLIAAGLLSKKASKTNRHSEKTLKAVFQRVLRKNAGRKITWSRELKLQGYRLQSLTERYGSLEETLRRFGVEPKEHSSRANWTRNDAYEQGRRFVRKNGRAPTIFDFKERINRSVSLPPYSVVRKFFGSNEQYAYALGVQPAQIGWTRGGALKAGLTFLRTHGHLPKWVNPGRKSQLPSVPAIKRLFGSPRAYFREIELSAHKARRTSHDR